MTATERDTDVGVDEERWWQETKTNIGKFVGMFSSRGRGVRRLRIHYIDCTPGCSFTLHTDTYTSTRVCPTDQSNFILAQGFAAVHHYRRRDDRTAGFCVIRFSIWEGWLTKRISSHSSHFLSVTPCNEYWYKIQEVPEISLEFLTRLFSQVLQKFWRNSSSNASGILLRSILDYFHELLGDHPGIP